MDNDITKMQWAKMYMDYLANGVDPVFNTDVDEDTLHNEQIISCFRFISDILARDIYEAENAIKNSNEFFITDEQIAALTTYSYNCKVSELARYESELLFLFSSELFSSVYFSFLMFGVQGGAPSCKLCIAAFNFPKL